MNGAELLVQALLARGVTHVAVLSGNGLDPFLVAAHAAGLRLVDTRNEQAASYLADAYARLTGRVGVCAVSSGVAHVNALAGVLNAYYDGAPVLLISGSSPTDTLGRGGFQDLDQVSLARPICKYAELVARPERMLHALHAALAAATSGRPGPVHLTLPLDVLCAQVDAPAELMAARPAQVVQRAAADAGLVRQAVELLAGARRPLIVAGSGVFYARGGPALARFARQTHIPIVVPIWDRGVVEQDLPEYLGVIGAASGEPPLLAQADVLLLAGGRVDYRVGYLDTPQLAAETRIIRVDVDAGELAHGMSAARDANTIAILADCRTAFEQLAQVWSEGRRGHHVDWLAEARRQYDSFYARWRVPVRAASQAAAQPAVGLTGADLIAALRAVLTDESVLLVDGGNIGQWAHMSLCAERYPGHWLTCGASAVVGWGVPGAMAARLAYPQRPVLLLTGDGALGFGLVEIESAARQGLPFVALVADDCAWGIVASGQCRAHGYTVASELGPADYAAVAQGLGGLGLRVERADELVPAIERGLASGRPTLIQVPIVRGGPADGGA